MPVLDKIIISGFKNIGFQELAFSSGINCITGDNGEGKTNLIDAIYYLSMTKSAFSQSDKFNSLNGCGKFSLSGLYSFENGLSNRYSVSVSETGKTVKVNDKVYERLSDHIGVLPIVLVSPNDVSLVNGFGEERRKFMNAIISQLDKDYLKAHQGYGRLLQQRNSILKSGRPDPALLEAVDSRLAVHAAYIYDKRSYFAGKMLPIVRQYYKDVSGTGEDVDMVYRSDLQKGDCLSVLKDTLDRDIAMGHTTSGIHRDDMEFTIGGMPLRKCGSQGQQKSFTVALKFAQFSIMRDEYGFPPLMLLDDLFDKLDPHRVSNLLKIVIGTGFGQIFLTDCNAERMRRIVDGMTEEKAYFQACKGSFTVLEP